LPAGWAGLKAKASAWLRDKKSPRLQHPYLIQLISISISISCNYLDILHAKTPNPYLHVNCVMI
jgi:hypothetical protein